MPLIIFIKNFFEVQLTYSVVLVFSVQQSDSVIYVHSHTHIYILYFLYILFYYGLSEDNEYSSLWHTAGLCCSSILYIIVCIC